MKDKLTAVNVMEKPHRSGDGEIRRVRREHHQLRVRAGTIKVAPGQAVTWTNADDSPHQVSVSGKPLETQVLLKGQSAAIKFDEPGSYGYICSLHPGMKGTVEVVK